MKRKLKIALICGLVIMAAIRIGMYFVTSNAWFAGRAFISLVIALGIAGTMEE